jgi:serine/threonine protein kinase
LELSCKDRRCVEFSDGEVIIGHYKEEPLILYKEQGKWMCWEVDKQRYGESGELDCIKGRVCVAGGRCFDVLKQKTKECASGAYKTCTWSLDREMNRIVACLLFPFSERRRRLCELQYTREIDCLEALKGVPGIVPLLGKRRTQHKALLFEPLYPQGDLQKSLQKGAFLPEQCDGIAFDLLQALSGMHERGIYHRDLKLANILYGDLRLAKLLFEHQVTQDFDVERVMQDLELELVVGGLKEEIPLERNFDLKTQFLLSNPSVVSQLKTHEVAICDFGLAYRSFAQDDPEECCGTLESLSPEQVELLYRTSHKFTGMTSLGLAKNDVFAMGLILYRIYHNVSFHNELFKNKQDKSQQKFLELFPVYARKKVEAMRPRTPMEGLIRDMLGGDPQVRPTAREAFGECFRILGHLHKGLA